MAGFVDDLRDESVLSYILSITRFGYESLMLLYAALRLLARALDEE